MKTLMYVFASFFVLTMSSTAFCQLNPASLKVNMYGIWASTSDQCTNPIQLFSSSSPVSMDMVANPFIGGGTIPAGTYKCLMFKVSDQVTVVPSTSAGSCVAGTSYTQDICGTGNSSTDLSGVVTNCSSSTTDIVFLYLTTFGTCTSGCSNEKSPPSGTAANSLKLSSPFVVTGSAAGTFVVNGNGLVGGTPCNMTAPPLFSFR